MPTIHERKSGRFLTKELVGKGMLLTITGWHEDNVAPSGQPVEMKDCLDFKEVEKPLVLNNTKYDAVAAICGTEEMDEWSGHKIVCYADPTIQMGGKQVGGIGVRAPKFAIAPAPPRPPLPKPRPPVPQPVPEPEGVPDPETDDVPF